MKSLIKDGCVLHRMPDTEVLEDEIRELFDKAVACMPQKGRAINLLNGNPFYDVDELGINKFWGETSHKIITAEEFFHWLSEQPESTKKEVYRNLQDYISTQTPKERGEIEFPPSRYPFGD